MREVIFKSQNTKPIIVFMPQTGAEISAGKALYILKQEETKRPKYTIQGGSGWIDPELRTAQQNADWLNFICSQLACACDCEQSLFDQSNPQDVKSLYNALINLLSDTALTREPLGVVCLGGHNHFIPNNAKANDLRGVTVGQINAHAKIENLLENGSVWDLNLYALANILQSVRKGYEPYNFSQRVDWLKKIPFSDYINLSFFLFNHLQDYANGIPLFSVAEQLIATKTKAAKNRELIVGLRKP